MKMSDVSFLPLREGSKDGDTINHRLLVQGAFVRQLMAGVYTYLPFGLRVLNKIRGVIREEMDALGGQEIHMPALHPAANWKMTRGWETVEVLFKLKSRTDKEYALGQSHEEIVTPLLKEFVRSYRDLPVAVYQLQWKFRDELRAKSGILRGREFEMKDMYSLHETQEDFERFYGLVKHAYLRAYTKLGLDAKVTEASGGRFSEKISYEFMVLTDAGEDDILYCPSCEFCVNVEIAKTKKSAMCPNCGKDSLAQARASEVGNVFDLGQKYVRDFGLQYTTREGKSVYPIMGCYGWGTTRTMGVLVEKFHDDKGIIWPEQVAPFRVHLITLKGGEDVGTKLYRKLLENDVEVVWDDREESPGVKFADADVIGVPVRLVVSHKTGVRIEWKERARETSELIPFDEVFDRLQT